MSTLHLVPESAHQTAAFLRRQADVLSQAAQSLRRDVSRLQIAWQGGRSESFQAESQSLVRQIQAQAEALDLLACRLETEIQEWEAADGRGADSWRGLFRSALAWLPLSGGGAAPQPLFAAFSLGGWLSGLPAWVKGWLERLFPPEPIHSPIPDEPVVPKGRLYETMRKGFARLEQKQASSTAQIVQRLRIEEPAPSASASPTLAAKPSDYPIFYQIPPKSQGTLYGGAACLPTAASMVMDYYHAGNSNLKTASPSELIDMLDPGDGTSGSGIGLDRLNDDLSELGYSASVRSGSMDDLESALRSGPVIANVRVGLVSQPARDILPEGSYHHAVLVKGMNDKSVVLNDPWSGSEKVYSRAEFEKMWKNGGNRLIEVRPREKQE